MARIDFSRFNFFSRLDARARIFFLVAAVVGVGLLIYLGTRLLTGGNGTVGPTRVATAPRGLQSVPGSESLTPEYQRALLQSGVQGAQQAQSTGGTFLPTFINPGQTGGPANCVICDEDAANINNYLDTWGRQGTIKPEVSQALQQLAARNATVDEFAAALNDLVKQGSLTPEQARTLLDQYKRQYASRQLRDNAKGMDTLIQSGQLPLDAANQLLEAQRDKVTPSEYARRLQELVRQGKISPAVAQQLLAQYTQQRAREIVLRSITILRQMTQAGQLTADVERELEDLENRLVPIDSFSQALSNYVKQGRMTPAVAAKILEEYRGQKAEIGPSESVNELLKRSEAAAFGEINDLLKAGTITQDVAAQLTNMIQRDIPFSEFQTAVNQLVAQKKLSQTIANLKMGDYRSVKQLREMSRNLARLQGNNATPAEYAAALKAAVQSGAITPEQAAQLMQEYVASRDATTAPTALAATTPTGTDDFAQLQQQVQEGTAAETIPTSADFAVAETEPGAAPTIQETPQERVNRLQALMAAMSGQAQQLIGAWQPIAMIHTEGSAKDDEDNNGKPGNGRGPGDGRGPPGGRPGPPGPAAGPPIIKAGTIYFAVLDTAVNSDYPDTPVLATIVEGKYRGAKLLGKLVTAKNAAGQLDRISLTFSLMDMESWPKGKPIVAYAVDPDTDRTAFASDVNHHYLTKYGAMIAASFLQGYGSAITNAGTSTTGPFGTSTTHPELDPRQRIYVALGQVGQNFGAVVQKWTDIPPTVKVDSGVGLGILFMSDVT